MAKIGGLKERLRAGKTVIGPFVIIPSVPMIDTLGYSGMDFCIIDTEHGPISMETATDLVIAAQGSDIAPIIRVGANDERLILRALDIGSEGVQVPQINTVEDAKYVVGPWLNYDPKSERHRGDFAKEANALLKDANRPGFEVPPTKAV